MTYTITHNDQFNSVEISFDGKPEQAIREALKRLRFRWHSVKKVWYGYTDEATARAAIEGNEPTAATTAKAAPAVNQYGVQVGDIFSASWGYEQTNVNFFQVVSLVGTSSARIREVRLPIVREDGVSCMSSDITYHISRDMMPALPSSVFIKDQENGDLKRIGKPFDSVRIKLDTHTNAYLCAVGDRKFYVSWYG